MTRLRSALAPIAATWLICKTSMFVATPAVFSAAVALLECTCSHGDHATCPMHHKAAPGSKICLMRSANDDGAAALGPLFGALGLPSALPLISAPIPIDIIVRPDHTALALYPSAPEPPPPRA